MSVDPVQPPAADSAIASATVAPLGATGPRPLPGSRRGAFASVVPGAVLAVGLAGCGSSTGELPIGPDAAFADPVSTSVEKEIASAGTSGADVSGRAPLPSPEPAARVRRSRVVQPLRDARPDGGITRRPTGTPRARRARRHRRRRPFRGRLPRRRRGAVRARRVGRRRGGARSRASRLSGRRSSAGGAGTSGTRDGVLAFAFENCSLDGVTLSGDLVRSTTPDGFRVGSSEVLGLDYPRTRRRRGRCPCDDADRHDASRRHASGQRRLRRRGRRA